MGLMGGDGADLAQLIMGDQDGFKAAIKQSIAGGGPSGGAAAPSDAVLTAMAAGGPRNANHTNRGVEADDGAALRLCGENGSPYSNKMLGVLRFRRIPHRWLSMNGPEAAGSIQPPGPQLLPKILWEDDTTMNDSTPMIAELERRYPANGRSVVPNSPALAFICALLEDYSDEWVTKAMFHYRWTYDIDSAAFGIAVQRGFGAGIESLRTVTQPLAPHLNFSLSEILFVVAGKLANFVAGRQVGRLHDVVGSDETTAPIIEENFIRLLHLMEAHLHAGHEFLLGSRPSSSV